MACKHDPQSHRPFGGCSAVEYLDYAERPCPCNLTSFNSVSACGVKPGYRVKVGDDSDSAATYDPPPVHYAGDGMDPWAVVEAFGLDYWTGSIVKYLCRAGKKDGESRLKDLHKARNFINKAIEIEEKK